MIIGVELKIKWNCLRHGIRYVEEGRGSIRISMKPADGGIVYAVEDNGAGINTVKRYGNGDIIEYQSRGLFLVRQRIEAMNDQRKKKIVLTIEDLNETGGRGTRVSIFFPFNEAG